MAWKEENEGDGRTLSSGEKGSYLSYFSILKALPPPHILIFLKLSRILH